MVYWIIAVSFIGLAVYCYAVIRTESIDAFVKEAGRKSFIRIGRSYYQVSRQKKFIYGSGDVQGRERVAKIVKAQVSRGDYIKSSYKGVTYYLKREKLCKY